MSDIFREDATGAIGDALMIACVLLLGILLVEIAQLVVAVRGL